MSEERFAQLENSLKSLSQEVSANTTLTQQVKGSVESLHASTKDMVDAFQAARGAFKVAEFIGKASVPILKVSATITAVGLFWSGTKSSIIAALARMFG